MTESPAPSADGIDSPADSIAAVLATVHEHGPGKGPHSEGPVRPEPPAVPGTPLSSLAAWGDFGAALARLLTDVLTPTRWEPHNPFNDHRAYPSPRAAYLIEPWLRIGISAWRVDLVRRTLAGPGSPRPARRVRLDLRRRPDRLPAGYGSLAEALAELETGHLMGALAERAPGHGLTLVPDPAGVTITPGASAAVALPLLPSWRSAGLGPRGVSADPRPLPESAARAVAEALTDPPPGSPAATSRLRVRLALRNVTGLPDGWYALSPSDPRRCDDRHPPSSLEMRQPGAAMAAVQAAFTYPPEQIHVGGMNLAVLITADVGRVVREEGPQAYPALLRAAGALAQHACTAAAVQGLFCRPVRSVREASLEAAAGAPAAHDLLYLALVGRPRFASLSYDLTPLARDATS
ncbi:hypothetical protein ACFYUK_03345 [Nonomuraea wenchangensis]